MNGRGGRREGVTGMDARASAHSKRRGMAAAASGTGLRPGGRSDPETWSSRAVILLSLVVARRVVGETGTVEVRGRGASPFTTGPPRSALGSVGVKGERPGPGPCGASLLCKHAWSHQAGRPAEGNWGRRCVLRGEERTVGRIQCLGTGSSLERWKLGPRCRPSCSWGKNGSRKGGSQGRGRASSSSLRLFSRSLLSPVSPARVLEGQQSELVLTEFAVRERCQGGCSCVECTIYLLGGATQGISLLCHRGVSCFCF